MNELLQILERASAEPDARFVVRNESAIAELVGPLPLRVSGEWLSIGVEGQPHLHLRLRDINQLRVEAPGDGNVGLEVRSSAGLRLVRITFARTNPAGKSCDAARREELIARYHAVTRDAPDGSDTSDGTS